MTAIQFLFSFSYKTGYFRLLTRTACVNCIEERRTPLRVQPSTAGSALRSFLILKTNPHLQHG
jgi:hypothetical protein